VRAQALSLAARRAYADLALNTRGKE
jgi:hypothetical protein